MSIKGNLKESEVCLREGEEWRICDGCDERKLCSPDSARTQFQINRQPPASPRFIWRSECHECRAWKKPISSKTKKEYEAKYPRPKVGTYFSCPICKRSIYVRTPKKVCLDHDHKTGNIRGYICNKCNAGKGGLRDDTVIFQRAIFWNENNGYPRFR